MIGVGLAPEALHELSTAAAWYESKREGLGTELLNEVEEVLPRIASMPESFPRLLDVPMTLKSDARSFRASPMPSCFSEFLTVPRSLP